jgi:hypothetical protein
MKLKNFVTMFIAFIISVLISSSVLSQSEFNDLWNGSFDGWVIENASGNEFTIVDGLLRVEGGSGWLRSEKMYGDFILRSEFRWLSDDTDSGLYLRALADQEFVRGWPGNSYQVQVRNPQGESRFPPVGGLFRHGTAAGNNALDEAALSQAFLGTNEWHTIEIEAVEEYLTISLNGIEIGTADNILNSPGYIGVQSELGSIEYRTIEIQEIELLVSFPPGIELPPGTGQALISEACTKCHDLKGLPAFKGYWNRDRWLSMIEIMINHGAELEPEEVNLVADYLAQHFGPN